MGLSMPRSRCPLDDRFGFGSYFQLTPGGDFSALLLTYGFPLFLIGCALKVSNQFVGLSSCRPCGMFHLLWSLWTLSLDL
jgi:hypothetical protein